MKRNLILKTLCTSFLGIILGIFVSSQLKANDSRELEIAEGDKITCWSSGGGAVTFHRYVECASCTSQKGNPSGGKGSCTN